MPLRKLIEYLDRHNIKYEKMSHYEAFTAQETAASAHVPGKELAKTVMVKIDGNMAMAVLPASQKINLDLLRKESHASRVDLAKEDEFEEMFPGCEIGAMPPFGNLYEMPVFVAEQLTEDDYISFNAGSHTELIRLSFMDYKDLVNPKIVKIAAR
jgi:Ala-tRNA(Pro) deacylase